MQVKQGFIQLASTSSEVLVFDNLSLHSEVHLAVLHLPSQWIWNANARWDIMLVTLTLQLCLVDSMLDSLNEV